jgi:hypothetical protein
MTRHEYSALTLFPSADVIALPTARRRRAELGTFTKSTVHKMRCPPGQSEGFFWDAGCRGFGIRALRSGRRSWIYQYRDEHGRTRRIVLGDVSAVRLDDARTAARRTAASVAQGSNPAVERRKKRAAGTVLEVIEAYLTYTKGRQRPRTYKETERHLRAHSAALHHDRAETVGRANIAALLARIAEGSGPVAAIWRYALGTLAIDIAIVGETPSSIIKQKLTAHIALMRRKKYRSGVNLIVAGPGLWRSP